MGTLTTPGAAPGSRRPHAWGEASGPKHGKRVTRTVEWLFDTGADVTVVQKALGACFDLVATGASASPTTGRRAILMKKGLTVTVTVEDGSGARTASSTSVDVGVKRDNAGSNLVGMDQLAAVGAVLEWNPAKRTGRLLR